MRPSVSGKVSYPRSPPANSAGLNCQVAATPGQLNQPGNSISLAASSRGQHALGGGVAYPGVEFVGHRVGELQVGDVGEQRAVASVEELGIDVVQQPRAGVPFLEIVEFGQVIDGTDREELDLDRVLGQLDDARGR